jgi:hypothetical protein
MITYVVEIGTGNGGLTKAIIDYTHVSILTVDKADLASHLNLYSPRVTRYIEDCLSTHFIDTLQYFAEDKKDVFLFLIDGGNKIEEFNYFKRFLKPNDYIFVHDFAPTPEDFLVLKNQNIWLWHESSEEHLNLNGLQRVKGFENIWKNFVWGAYQNIAHKES